jgi:hypothetical protein
MKYLIIAIAIIGCAAPKNPCGYTLHIYGDKYRKMQVDSVFCTAPTKGGWKSEVFANGKRQIIEGKEIYIK